MLASVISRTKLTTHVYLLLYCQHIQSWEIEEKLVCVLQDSMVDMIAGMCMANILSLPCLTHSLQLLMKDGVLLQPVVQQLLSCT